MNGEYNGTNLKFNDKSNQLLKNTFHNGINNNNKFNTILNNGNSREEKVSRELVSNKFNGIDSCIRDKAVNKISFNNCCKYCGKNFKLKKSLSNHLLRSHPIIKSEFKCNINGCNCEILIKSLFEKHAKKHKTKVNDSVDSKTQSIGSDNNGIVCEWPNYKLKFKNRTSFQRHYLIHRESGRLCPYPKRGERVFGLNSKNI